MTVTVICEKTGLEFEASSKRTKNHPKIMSILNEANKDGWYNDALQSIKEGREARLNSIEAFIALLEQTKEAYDNQRMDAFRQRRRIEEMRRDARRERAYTNAILSSHGYSWSNIGFADEEEADAFDINAPIGTEWQLFSADRRAVTVVQAMREIAATGSRNAENWLTERNIAVTEPTPEPAPAISEELATPDEDEEKNTAQGDKTMNTRMTTYRGEHIAIEVIQSGTVYQYHLEGQSMATLDGTWQGDLATLFATLLEPVGCMVRDGKIVSKEVAA